MRPSTMSAPKGGCDHSAGSPSVTTSVCPSSNRLRPPGRFSPSQPMTFGRPGATGCTSTWKPSRRSQASTKAATRASVASGSAGRYTLGMRTSERVSSTTSSASILRRTCDSAVTAGAGRLFERKREDDRVEPDHAMLFPGDVEVMPFHLFGVLLEGHHRADRRHVPEGIGPLVEAVAAAHHLAVADRRALRTMHAHVRRGLDHEPHEEVDAVHLELDIRHGSL